MATYYTVSTAAELNADIAAIDAAGVANTGYQITITTDLTLGADLTPIALAAGDTLTITGNSGPDNNPTAVIDGNNSFRGFVVQSGAVTLDALNVINMV